MPDGAAARLRHHLTHPLPLLDHLVLRTETHAYCAGLAFFALVGFYPVCLLLLSVTGDLLGWNAAGTVIRETLREYYPEAQAFLVRNLEVSLRQHGRELTVTALFWILLGAAGVFVPLETAFNQLWGVAEHRPYWRNQVVGFLLTSACGGLAFLFVSVTAGLRTVVAGLGLPPLIERTTDSVALRLCALALSGAAIFLFYRFLPNRRVRAAEVWPAAVAAGLVVEVVRLAYLQALPLLHLQRSQGPYYVSVSFALLAYVEAFVVLGGAYVAARPVVVPTASAPPASDEGDRPAPEDEADPPPADEARLGAASPRTSG